MRRVLNLPSIWVPSINLAFGKPYTVLNQVLGNRNQVIRPNTEYEPSTWCISK